MICFTDLTFKYKIHLVLFCSVRLCGLVKSLLDLLEGFLRHGMPVLVRMKVHNDLSVVTLGRPVVLGFDSLSDHCLGSVQEFVDEEDLVALVLELAVGLQELHRQFL